MTIWEFLGHILVTCQDWFVAPFAGTAIAIHGTNGSIPGQAVLWRAPGGMVTVRTATGTRVTEFEHHIFYDRTVVVRTGSSRRGMPSASGEDGLRSLEPALSTDRTIKSGIEQCSEASHRDRLQGHGRAQVPEADGRRSGFARFDDT